MANQRTAAGHNALLTGDIGEQLAALFLTRLGLTPRKEDKDRGEDLSIEVVGRDGRIARVWVQVKGSARYAINARADGFWKVNVRANAIARYRDTANLVILLAPDTSTDEIRWCPLRPHVELKSIPEDKAGTFYLGPGDVVTAAMGEAFAERLVQLLQDVRAAQADVPSLLRTRGDQLEALDPRFAVDVSATRSGLVHTITAKDEPVEVQVTVHPSSREDAEALLEAIGFGAARQIAIKQLGYTGSPLFDELGSVEPVTMEVGATPKITTAAVGTVDPASNAFTRVYPGTVAGRGGILGEDLHFSHPDVPFELRIRQSKGDWRAAKTTLSWRIDRWIGRPVANLPFLARTRQLTERLLGGHRLALALTEHDEDHVAASFNTDDPALVEHASEWSEILSDAALIDAAYGHGALVRGGSAQLQEIAAIKALAAVLRGQTSGTLPSGTLPPRSFRLETCGPGDLPAGPNSYFAAMDLTFQLWGEDLAAVPVILRMESYIAEAAGSAGVYVARPADHGTLRFRLDTRADRASALTADDVAF